MSVLESLQQYNQEHVFEHEQGIITNKANFCELCYPSPPLNSLSQLFQHFWFWFSNYLYAVSYTSYTTTAFGLFVQIYEQEPVNNNIVTERLTKLAARIVSSLKYTAILPTKLLVYYLINLTV